MRWLPLALVLSTFARATSSAQPADSSAVEAILATAADTLAAEVETTGRGGWICAADAPTARALTPAVRRGGYVLRVSSSEAPCRDAESGHAERVVYSLRLHSLAGDEAVVAWSATVRLRREGEAPFVGGEGGILTLARDRGRWKVTRSSRFSM